VRVSNQCSGTREKSGVWAGLLAVSKPNRQSQRQPRKLNGRTTFIITYNYPEKIAWRKLIHPGGGVNHGTEVPPVARGAMDGRAPLFGGQSDQHPQLAAQGDALWVTDPRSGGAFRRWGAIRHPSLVLFRVFRGLKPSVPLCLRGDMALPPPF